MEKGAWKGSGGSRKWDGAWDRIDMQHPAVTMMGGTISVGADGSVTILSKRYLCFREGEEDMNQDQKLFL